MLSTTKKSKSTTFSRVFHPKNRQFFQKIKVEFLDKNEDFEQCVNFWIKYGLLEQCASLWSFSLHWCQRKSWNKGEKSHFAGYGRKCLNYMCNNYRSTIIIDSLSSLGFGFLPDILSQKCMVIWQTLGSIFLRSKFRRNIDNPYCIRWHFGSLWPGKWLNISNNANTSKSAVCLLTSSKQRPRFTMRLSWCLKHSCPCSQSLSIRQVFRRFLGSMIESFFHG